MGLAKHKGLHAGATTWYHAPGPGVPEGPPSGNDNMKRDVIDTLTRHFHCLAEQVTCSRVKPFLPGLLIPSVQIRIPTPITVHLDHCGECADDLAALRALDLEAGQLERLERLYGLERATAGTARRLRSRLGLCRRARACIPALVRGRLDEIDPAVLDHLCTCPRCRPKVHDSRRRLLESGEPDRAGAAAACNGGIPMAQLFDYAVPYGRGDGAGRPSASRPARPRRLEGTPSSQGVREAHVGNERPAAVPGEHVRNCRPCLRRIQEMDETVYGIAERTDSGVVTLYHTRSKKSGAPSQPATGAPGAATCRTGPEAAEAGAYIASVCNLYEKYPIHVQIRRGAPQPAAGPAARQRACNPQVRFLLKTAVAAAAMIPLAFLFLHTTTASGTTLAQILKAMEKAPNVHVTRFFQDTDQVTYEMWVCRKPDIVLTAIERERTLYDLARWKKYADPTLAPAGGALDMSERERAGVRLLVETCLGFRAEDIPRGARWIRVDDNMSDASETYELTYSESGLGGGVLFRKCVIRIDSVTKLPIAVRGFRKASPKDNWEYARRTELQYLTAAQMAATLKQQGVRAESGIY